MQVVLRLGAGPNSSIWMRRDEEPKVKGKMGDEVFTRQVWSVNTRYGTGWN